VIRRLGLALGGAALGLGLLEGAFRWRDDGAFPHVNLYRADPDVGARLVPGSTQRLAFGGNPTTSLRVNAEGYRGADWGAPSGGEVVVVGDSQVFGLGVEEGQTASAKLAELTGRVVRNAGVPTWGPPEYLVAIDELLAARKPATVVVVLNLANDLFERDRPNRERHVIWDGWAVRAETAPRPAAAPDAETAPPPAPTFPGRQWLFSRSHLVFAVRRALYSPWDPGDRGLPSEGGLADLIPGGNAVVHPTESALAERVDSESGVRAEAERDLADLYVRVFEDRDPDAALRLQALREHANPGDIVGEYEAEGGRSIVVTAELLREAAQARKGMDRRLAAWAEEHAGTELADRIVQVLGTRDRAVKQLDDMAGVVGQDDGPTSPLASFVTEARGRVARAGAELVIVALPVDVQVSPEEWKKYGKPSQDLSGTEILLDELVEGARRMGVRAVNPLVALRAAEPGAFLTADIHLSPKGQAALAAAIAEVLAQPAPNPVPAPGLPAGRSRVPTARELQFAPEVRVTGSTRNHCSTRRLREWLLVECARRGAGPQVSLQEGSRETMWNAGPSGATLLTPLLPGRGLRATFSWPKAPADDEGPWNAGERQELSITWSGDEPTVAFAPASGTAAPAPPDPAWRELERAVGWQTAIRRDPACLARPSVQERVACATGSRAALPSCPAGAVNAGSGGFCAPVCDADQPCVEGACADWRGVDVCL
jgi:hypothetical protein